MTSTSFYPREAESSKLKALRHRGVTLIELLMAVSILVLLGGLLFLALGRFNLEKALDGGREEVIAALRDAQHETLASVGGTTYGVHLESDRITIFGGSAYDAGSQSNRVIRLSPRVTLSSSLTGGASDIVFMRLSGKPSVTGTITISLSSDTSKTRLITLGESGLTQ